jgi:lipoate-protein ligase A
MEQFSETNANYVNMAYPATTEYHFSDYDIRQINSLAEEKYRTWDWNFGYSPRFVLDKTEIINGFKLSLRLEVENGIIAGAKITEDETEIPKVSDLLIGIKFKEDILELIFPEISIQTDILRRLFFY